MIWYYYMKTVIIGGGAAGIAAAIKLKQNMPNADVIVLEHLEEACKKLHATGNGRCNLTNKNANGYEITKDFFNSLGLIMRESDEGRMYPYSNQAISVVEILMLAIEKYDVKIVFNCETKAIAKADSQYIITTNKGIFECDALVLATGGMAQKALGSDGSGYELAKMLGHTTTDLCPALVMLKSSSKHCKSLKGVRVKSNLKIEIDGNIVDEEYGELLFADYGISGIVVMNLSKHINDNAIKNGKQKCIAIIDFVPDMSEQELVEHYNRYNNYIGVLPQKLCSILSKQANDDSTLIAKYAKNWRIIITGTKGFEFAQITKGGISNDELTDSYESRLNDYLYIIGELTDNQFKCGGYNLDHAFSSGVKAANDITNKFNK